MSSYFPDVNVWLALTLSSHEAFPAARAWYDSLDSSTELIFSRISQMSFLRLLTTRTVSLEATISQREAWRTYDRWIEKGGATFVDEPIALEKDFRAWTRSTEAAPKAWTDGYLAAFAAALGVPLVTFDKALSRRCPESMLLSI